LGEFEVDVRCLAKESVLFCIERGGLLRKKDNKVGRGVSYRSGPERKERMGRRCVCIKEEKKRGNRRSRTLAFGSVRGKGKVVEERGGNHGCGNPLSFSTMHTKKERNGSRRAAVSGPYEKGEKLFIGAVKEKTASPQAL